MIGLPLFDTRAKTSTCASLHGICKWTIARDSMSNVGPIQEHADRSFHHDGRRSLSDDVEDRAAHASDRWPVSLKWTEDERLARAPSEVARPRSTNEVVAILRQATAAGRSVVPFGAGSGVVGGVVPCGDCLTIDLSEMAEVVEIDDASGTVTVEAGILAGDLERILNERGRRVPHYPQSLHLASVGGLVATRSSGTFSSKYGNIEDLLVGVQAVLADGTIVQSKVIPRGSVGPDLAQIFVGSEGSFGIITQVTLRTYAVAEARLFQGASFDTIEGGLTAVRAVLERGIRPAVIRLYDDIEAAHLYEKVGIERSDCSLLILAFDGPTELVEVEESAALAEVSRHGGKELGSEIGEAWERGRFDATWFTNGNSLPTGLADAIEVSASWPTLGALRDKMVKALAPFTDRVYAHYSHFYSNGGSLYVIFETSGATVESARERYTAAWDAAMETVIAEGGCISHHHGVGMARRKWIAQDLGSSHEILQRIKSAMDPNGILNPGKLGVDRSEEGS